MTDPDDYRDLTVTATMTETTALLPCPFCGFDDPLVQDIEPHKHAIAGLPDHPGSATVECPACAIGLIKPTRAEAVAAWNHRATPAALSASPAGWRSMDSAPKDGTPVLIWGANLCVPGEMAVAVRSDEHDDLELWDIHDGKHGPYRLRGPSPTHWMPLPPAPAAEPSAAPQEALTDERGVSKLCMDLLKAMHEAPTMEAGYEMLADFTEHAGLGTPVPLRSATPAAGEALEETAKRIMWAIERNGPYNAGTADGRWHSMPKESRDRCLRAALAAARKE